MVDLEDKKIKEETRQEFNKPCDQFDDTISKGSDDIGKTLLVEMDIDTGDPPLIASKPYTLSLKHYDWVQKEITALEKAGIITNSISPWASPVVIVPKKSAPEPPQRRMCVDFRRLNKQLPEVKMCQEVRDVSHWNCYQKLTSSTQSSKVTRFSAP